MSKIKQKVIAGLLAGSAVAVLAGLIITGWQIGWGPFSFFFKGYGDEVAAIEKRYPLNSYQDGIIFYGASNFRLWTEMENDLSEYRVQNHGFGGSTDKMLVEFADRILYPYQPSIVVFQTGSNNYANLDGSDAEKVAACMEFKRNMFEAFHEVLPDARFVVMSGLLLPGRSQYTKLTQAVNEELRRFCEGKDYLYFVDASEMTYDGSQYAKELFINDGIHLNHDGQMIWCNSYIRPQLDHLIDLFELNHLKK